MNFPIRSGDARSADVATARGTTGPRLEAESVVGRRWPPLRRRDAGCCCRFAGEEAAGRARNASAHRSAAAAEAAALNPVMARESQPLGHLLIPTLQRISATVARLAHSLRTETVTEYQEATDTISKMKPRRTHDGSERAKRVAVKRRGWEGGASGEARAAEEDGVGGGMGAGGAGGQRSVSLLARLSPLSRSRRMRTVRRRRGWTLRDATCNYLLAWR